MQKNKSLAIIGSGPSGLMMAEMAAPFAAVTLYDHMASPGRKLLMAGRGGLNLTHSEGLDVFVTRYGSAQPWLEPAIRAFPPQALRAWCEGLGQETFIGSSGRIFPRAMKAAPLLRAWLARLDALGVTFASRHRWQGWKDGTLLFTQPDGSEHAVQADATLLALGGASWPRLGSDGGWAGLLAARGVELALFRPANSGFTVAWSPYFSGHFGGQPLKPVAITHNGITRQGEAMLTQHGIEGGVIYALSSQLREAIARQGHTQLTLDLRPGMDAGALARKLGARGSRSLSTHLQRAGFAPLTAALLREAFTAGQLSSAAPAALAGLLKALPLTLTGAMGLERAISSAGGITRGAVDGHFMLRALPGVFVAGEMLDWEAPTGGYLLQGCFSTAMAAAEGAKRWLGMQH